MADINQVVSDFDTIIDLYGTPTWRAIGSKVYGTAGDYDEVTWASAGSDVISGLVLNITPKSYTEEYKYNREGALQETEYAFFTKASGTYNTEDRFVFNSGSYWVVAIQPPALVAGSEIYQKLRLRKLV